ncbi:FAD synthetase family protein [Aquamicrobium sp. NLF2-7]|uniref:FAD synthetase family protein n=1 Tax=Aquamicrobium sp. NLF2-7 TaxID=2918753 RepID=UPI001EFA80DC|nr:FAD synthetase family protein [Aquamicrobium sp. NLF2-7]MCG8274112.1 FAD synthetase family protein [Aquamicrobium sp. NLF2-7]
MFSDFCGVRTQVLPEGRLELGASVVTIGAFDGMHLGHQALVRRMVAEARALGLPSVVWTFDPPPRVFFTGVQQLSTLDEKLVRMATIGPDHIVVASFTETYRQRSAEDFIEGLRRIGPARILVGADFRFGAQQTGDVELLARHFDVKVFDPVRCPDSEVVSSSRIRRLRREGRRDLADLIHGCPDATALVAGWMLLDQSPLWEEFHA